MILDEPPLRAILSEGRAVARVVNTALDYHRRVCPCVLDRERLSVALGASPDCLALPEPVSLDRRPAQLDIEDLEQLAWRAAVLLRQGSVARPPVTPNVMALLDPDRRLYIKADRLARRADHQLVGGAWVVRVNSRLIPPAQRFALLAEGFHILREAGMLDLGSRGDPALDWLSRKWAALVLMPERWVRDLWKARDRHVAHTALAFGVSTSAMRIRLRELGLLECGDRP